MELVVKGKNIEVPESIRDYVEKKVGKLDHYLDQITETRVEVAEGRTRSQGDHFVIQVTAFVNGTILRAEEKDANARTAVDAVTHAIIQQIMRYKGKIYGRGKPGPSIRTAGPDLLAEPEEKGEEIRSGTFVRTKRFAIKPMYPEEAAEQMELLGHDFFLFFNAATDQYGVVYRRADGHYGLIEPELP